MTIFSNDDVKFVIGDNIQFERVNNLIIFEKDKPHPKTDQLGHLLKMGFSLIQRDSPLLPKLIRNMRLIKNEV